ncbi:MAG: alanine racemase [Burkholderiales bacterium]
MSRPARIEIDVAALRHNYRLLRRVHGGRVLAVLKADAYGHGAECCANVLAGEADGFAVAFGDEAAALRAAGVRAALLVLEGVFGAKELDTAARECWWIVVHHEDQLRMIERCPAAQPLHVWLKADTGMHRCGFDLTAVRGAYQRLLASGKVASITLMTHFARADEVEQDFTVQQISRFDQATAGLPGLRSLANSAGVLCWPAARRDWARCGIALYGADPRGGNPSGDALRPVMKARSEIIAVRDVAAGEAIGYGARFVADRATRVGLVAFGYADGYPRAAGNGTPVAVDKQRTGLVGRVSMDMLTVDLTDLPGTGIGGEVELWGPNIPVGDVAASAGTIAYELLCNAKRAPRVTESHLLEGSGVEWRRGGTS